MNFENFELNSRKIQKFHDRKIVRRFKDMENSYKNISGIKSNPLIYSVYILDFGLFEIGLTVIEPGRLDNEFYMTKGHKHKKSRKEIYILLAGTGKLLVQERKTKIISLEKNKIYTISKKAGHRLINTGKNKLEVLTIYSKDSGHDYGFKFKKRVLGGFNKKLNQKKKK